MEKYQKIFKSLNIPQIMKTYDFLNISNSDLEKMILQIIKNALTKETDEEKIKIIIKNDLDTKFQALTQKQLSNEEELLAVLQKFISSNLKKKKSSQALQEIKKFINYVKLLGVSLNVDICMKLIQENELLNNLISLLLKNSENKIKIDEYINLFDEDVEQLIGEQLITSYCLIKNIKIDNSLEEAFDENIELYDGMDSIKSYIYEITRLPLLTLEQEQELGLRILQKDKQAIDTLVEHNLRLVISIAKKYANIGGMTLLDLIQEGNIGVIKAAQRFDVTKGYRFSTYATWWIKQSITRAIADKAKSIRIPANFSQKIFKLNKISSELETKLSRKPTIEELMKETDFSAQEIEELQKNNITVLSLNANIKDDEDAELGEFIVDDNFNLEDMAQKKIFSEELRECLKNVKLNNKELEVIYLRNGFINNRVWTLEEIAKKLNVTRERIRQIENTALRKLRVNPTIKKMAIYTDNPINSLYNVGDTHSNNLPKQMEKTYNLYTILKINSKRRLDDALARLYEEEYALVIKRFGSNYQSLNTTTWTTSDNDKFKNDVLPVLKDLIANPFKYRIDVPDCQIFS